MKAIWNETIIAESDETLVIEGNHYFPAESIKKEYFTPSDMHSYCPWKGEASYYTVEANGSENEDSAWYYPETKEAAKPIEGYVAFWKGIKIED